MATLLPQDIDNNPIQALRLKANGAHTIAVTSTSTTNTTALSEDTRVISIYSEVPIFIALGDNTITATANDHFIPAGLYYDLAIGGGKTGHATHIAALGADIDGTLYISEKE